MNNYTKQFRQEIIDNFKIEHPSEEKVFLITVIKFLSDIKFTDNDCLLTLNFTDEKLKDMFVGIYKKNFNVQTNECRKKDGSLDIFIKDDRAEALSRLDLLTNDGKIVAGFPPGILIANKESKIILIKVLSFLLGNLVTPKKQFPYFWTFYDIEDVMGVKNILRSLEIESGIKILENDVKKLFIKRSEHILKFLSLLGLEKAYDVWNSLLDGDK